MKLVVSVIATLAVAIFVSALLSEAEASPGSGRHNGTCRAVQGGNNGSGNSSTATAANIPGAEVRKKCNTIFRGLI